uniref:guanylate kinase n=1 Tax=Pyrodinium bahamense TaxID=73915 RepID=A0A7S0FYL7_9DINO
MPLSAPVTAVAVERSAGILGRAAVAAMQGVRNNFEDAHFLDHTQGVCAVYDGHLGDEAAAFCAERLHLHVEAAGEPSRSTLLAAFSACDREMRAGLPEGSESGATATLAMVREDGSADQLKVWVASCGDSRAVLWRKDGGALEATRDHRPGDAEEKARIEAAGGFVSEEFDPPRVDGQLACSRALGAFKFKQDSALPEAGQKVSGVPEVYEWSAKRGDWLLLACDGVWDTFSSERVAKEVCETNGSADLGGKLERVLQLCIEKEADDNLTLLAIELGAAPEEPRKLEVTPGNFLKTKDSEVLEQYEAFCLRFGFALKREMVPKAPPKAALSETQPVPAPGRFASLPAPAVAAAPEAVAPPTAAPEAPAPPEAAPEETPAKPPQPMLPVEGLRPLIIVGPSGVGKGTIIERIKQSLPGLFGFSVSHTTRAPRPGEANGVHYHFTDLETMKRETEETDKFIEFAHVHGNIYGTSKAAVEAVRKQGKVCLLDIDVQGAQKVKERGSLPDAKYIFIAPPDLAELEKRLRGRGTESEESLQRRTQNAKGEMEFCERNRSFFDHVLVNDDLAAATRRFLSLLRGWYPGISQLMKVTAQRGAGFYASQRGAGFYARAAHELLAGKPGRPPPFELEVQGLGNAIPVVASVVLSLVADGHKVVQVETTMVEVIASASKRKLQTPRVSVIVLRSPNSQGSPIRRMLRYRGTSQAQMYAADDA